MPLLADPLEQQFYFNSIPKSAEAYLNAVTVRFSANSGEDKMVVDSDLIEATIY
jgi:hypothetical protein